MLRNILVVRFGNPTRKIVDVSLDTLPILLDRRRILRAVAPTLEDLRTVRSFLVLNHLTRLFQYAAENFLILKRQHRRVGSLDLLVKNVHTVESSDSRLAVNVLSELLFAVKSALLGTLRLKRVKLRKPLHKDVKRSALTLVKVALAKLFSRDLQYLAVGKYLAALLIADIGVCRRRFIRRELDLPRLLDNNHVARFLMRSDSRITNYNAVVFPDIHSRLDRRIEICTRKRPLLCVYYIRLRYVSVNCISAVIRAVYDLSDLTDGYSRLEGEFLERIVAVCDSFLVYGSKSLDKLLLGVVLVTRRVVAVVSVPRAKNVGNGEPLGIFEQFADRRLSRMFPLVNAVSSLELFQLLAVFCLFFLKAVVFVPIAVFLGFHQKRVVFRVGPDTLGVRIFA